MEYKSSKNGLRSSLGALAVLGLFAPVALMDKAWAENARSLPSFRTMERVTRNVQRPLVDAVVDLHESFTNQVNTAIEQVNQAKQQKETAAVARYLPAIQPAAQSLVTSEIGQRFFAAVQSQVGTSTGGDFTDEDMIDDGPTPTLPGFPDPKSLATDKLERLNGLAQKFSSSVTSALEVVSPATVDSLVQLKSVNATDLSSSTSRLTQLADVEIPATNQLISQASASLGSLQQSLSLNELSRDMLQGEIASLQGALSQIEPIEANLAQITSITDQINSLSSQLLSVNSTITGLMGEISSLSGVISGLQGSLTSLISQADILKLVDVPFFKVAGDLLGGITQGVSLSTIAGEGLNILRSVSGFSGIPNLINQVASLGGAISFVSSSYQGVLVTLLPIANQLSGGSLVGIVDRIIQTPLDLAKSLIPSLGSANSGVFNLLSSGSNLFGSSVFKEISRATGGLQIPLTMNASSMAALSLAGEGASPRMAQLSSAPAQSSKRAVLPFGDPSRRATSKTFCSSVAKARRAKCVSREARNWARFTAGMRSVVRKGVSKIKSPFIVKQIEKEAFFGRELSAILGEAVSKARAVELPQ